MREAYLADEEDPLDGFEFLTMAEAGEVGHWSIVAKLNEKAGNAELRKLTDWALPIQQRHLQEVLDGSLSSPPTRTPTTTLRANAADRAPVVGGRTLGARFLRASGEPRDDRPAGLALTTTDPAPNAPPSGVPRGGSSSKAACVSARGARIQTPKQQQGFDYGSGGCAVRAAFGLSHT